MPTSIRRLLHRIEPEASYLVTVPDLDSGRIECRLLWAARLHHEFVFRLPDGGFHQVNFVIVVHPHSGTPHAFLIASHEDHEGTWQEFVPCDDLLDCLNWESFLDQLYAYRLDSGLDLSVTHRDAFISLMPDWLDVFV